MFHPILRHYSLRFLILKMLTSVQMKTMSLANLINRLLRALMIVITQTFFNRPFLLTLAQEEFGKTKMHP